MVARPAPTRFMYAVLCAVFISLSTAPGIIAQVVLAFSTTASQNTDGFNNGIVLLPSASAVPIAIGVYDDQTGVPAVAPTTIRLAISITDVFGSPHPQLRTYGTTSATIAAGSLFTTLQTGFKWLGSGATAAIVRVHDLDNALTDIEIAVWFDPQLTGNVHIAARIVEDRNYNGTYDSEDIPRSDIKVKLCNTGAHIVPRSDGTYAIDLPNYTDGFPLRMMLTEAPQWPPVQGTPRWIDIEGYGAYTPVYLVQRAKAQWIWSGIVHQTSDDMITDYRDSSMVVSTFATASSLTMNIPASHWRMTSLITPNSERPGELTMSVYADACQNAAKLGDISIHCENEREIVTPMFTTAYTMRIYYRGTVVYTQDARTGAAVSLRRTVRRWFARTGAIGIEELQGAKVQVVGGSLFRADSIVFSPQEGHILGAPAQVICTGKNIDTLEIFHHEVRIFNNYHRASGTTLPVQTEASALNLITSEHEGGATVALPPDKVTGFTVEWGAPISATGNPIVELHARGGRDGLTRELGTMAFRTNNLTTTVHALQPIGDNEGAVVQVQLLMKNSTVATGTATGDTALFCSTWPYRASIKLARRTIFAGQWQFPVVVRLTDGRTIACDEFRLLYPATGQHERALSSIAFRLPHGDLLPLYDESTDTVFPALPLTAKITITGNAYHDKNANASLNSGESGRANRIIVFRGDPSIGTQIAYDTTDSFGVYSAEFDPLQQGWAPETISMVTAPGWTRTSPDHDLLNTNRCNMTLGNIDFGEIPSSSNAPLDHEWYSGLPDNFLENGTEYANPAGPLETLAEHYGYEPTTAYDSEFRDMFFLHTFEGIKPDGCVAMKARLYMRLNACTEDSYNDGILLQAAAKRFWHSDISLCDSEGVWYRGRTSDITLVLDSLVQRGIPYNAMPFVQSGELDLVIDDDTRIDYAALAIQYECVVDDPQIMPTGVALPQRQPNSLQIFPNPSTGTGAVAFTLLRSEPVTIVVYDLLNREVARLIEGVSLPAGHQTIAFTLPLLANGRYIVAVHTGASTRTQSLWIQR